MREKITEFINDHKGLLLKVFAGVLAVGLLAGGTAAFIALDPFSPKQPVVEQKPVKIIKQLTTEEAVKKVEEKLKLPDLDYKQRVDNAGDGWMFTTETYETDALKSWVADLQKDGWELIDEGEMENFYQATLTKRTTPDSPESKIYVTSGIDEAGVESTWVDVRGTEVV